MISIKNILTISAFEAKVLWRNWFFRIIAILGIGFLTIFNLVVVSEIGTPDWRVLANGWILPSASLLMISIPQAAAVIFLATGLIKKDKKLDTNEVFFVRPISNLDYVFGKALALFKLFFLLTFALLCIPLIVGLTSPYASVSPKAFIISPLLTSFPTIVFVTGIAFLLVTIIKNQPVSIVLLIGLAGFQFIYYFDKFSNIFDFMAFRLPMLASEMNGFPDIELALWQRSFYFITGIACLFLTAIFMERLPGHNSAQKATAVISLTLLVFSSLIMFRLWNMRHEPIAFREQMITANGHWATVPNADILQHAINFRWRGNELQSTSEVLVENKTNGKLDSIYFTLNPGLIVSQIEVDGKRVQFRRDVQFFSIDEQIDLQPGDKLRLTITYGGPISEAAAHLEVDQNRYDDANEFLLYSLKKKYAYLEDDYVLLTSDVLWYPDSKAGYNRKIATRGRRSFIDFQLTVKVPPGKTPVSQGKMIERDSVYVFKPEYPLPQISLVIGDYHKKAITLGGVEYTLYHHRDNDFFIRQLDQLGDTLGHLIKDVADEYEDAQKLSYPFKRMQFVEVPVHFTAYNKIYESYQAFLQPESVFWPEKGGDIRQFDFRRQLRDMNEQAAHNNQILTEKQKQANVFNDLVRKVFTKQTGSDWVNDGAHADNPDYSLFPNYYDFSAGFVSNDLPLLNRSISTYLRNDRQVQNDYSRNINGISFTEECNQLMRKSPLNKVVTEAPFSKITKSVTLKSEYLFSYLSHTLGENNFKSFLYDWINTHQHQLTEYEDFRKAIMSRFGLDIDPVIRKVYNETSQPAFEIGEVQKYEVMDRDRKRYQVLLEIKNSGQSDGVMEIKFETKENSDDNDQFEFMNGNTGDETPTKVLVVNQGETKLFGFVLDDKPNDITINTMVSHNIPSVITIPVGVLSKRDGNFLFDGERVIDEMKVPEQYELIVDNEDPAFSTFSPVKPTILKAYLDSQTDQKYYGTWASSYSKWLPTTNSAFYGEVVRSAHTTRSGNGEKTATWTAELKEDGFYDVYVYMIGKNQNEFRGSDDDGRQFEYHYSIKNADGTDHIKYNITNAEPGWNYLGSYYFSKTGGSVTLTDECGLRIVYADAVKWVKQ